MKHKLNGLASLKRRLEHARQAKVNRLRASNPEVWNAAIDEAAKAAAGKPSLVWLVADICALKTTEAAQ